MGEVVPFSRNPVHDPIEEAVAAASEGIDALVSTLSHVGLGLALEIVVGEAFDKLARQTSPAKALALASCFSARAEMDERC